MAERINLSELRVPQWGMPCGFDENMHKMDDVRQKSVLQDEKNALAIIPKGGLADESSAQNG